MARAVLAALVVLAACTQRSIEPRGPLPAPACPPTLDAAAPDVRATYAEFRASVEAGPLLRAAVRHAGDGLHCRARADGSAVVVEYASADGTRLTARRDAAIELTEQQLLLPGLTLVDALALLRAVETDQFGADGCGIEWGRSSTAVANGTRQTTFTGTVCNCRAIVVLRPDGQAELRFTSAC